MSATREPRARNARFCVLTLSVAVMLTLSGA